MCEKHMSFGDFNAVIIFENYASILILTSPVNIEKKSINDYLTSRFPWNITTFLLC